jgi:hypothetical protein
VERHAMPCAFLPITLVLKEMQILRNIVAWYPPRRQLPWIKEAISE